MKKRKIINNIARVFLIVGICFFDITFSALYIFNQKNNNTLLSVKNASENLIGTMVQNIITELFPIFLFLLMMFLLKRNFTKELYLNIRSKRQVNIVMLLAAILISMTIIFLVIKEDKVTIIYNLLYYVFFVAFAEEFVIRGVSVYVIKDFSTIYRYFIPNFLFAFMHIFSYSNWNSLTLTYVIHFTTSDLLGLIASGCMLQFLKEKTGTLWIPILLHAIMDYSIVFVYR